MIFKRLFYSFLILFSIFFIFSTKDVYAKDRIFSLEKITISEKSDNIDVSILSFNENSFKTKETFHKLNDYVIYNLTIKNSSKTDTGSNLYFLCKIGDPEDTDENFNFIEIRVSNTGDIQMEKAKWDELSTEPLTLDNSKRAE